MKYSIQILPESSLIVERVEGEITLQDLKKKTQALLKDPRYNKDFLGVIDMRKAYTQMSKRELQQFADFLNSSEQLKETTWALLGDDPMVVALSQVLQQQMSGSNQFGVFGTVEQAARFLGKPELLDLLSD